MQNLTDITVLLDRSGSMESIREDTIGGFNTFVKDQQAQVGIGPARLTLIQFDGQGYDTVIEHRAIEAVSPLTVTDFQPRGNTPLLDAMARMIDEAGKRFDGLTENDRPDKVVAVIITDGMENASTHTTREDVLARVKMQQEQYGWMFLYLGANQDAIAVASLIGIGQQHAASYAANAAGAHATYNAVSHMVSGRRHGKAVGAAAFSPAERAAMGGKRSAR